MENLKKKNVNNCKNKFFVLEIIKKYLPKNIDTRSRIAGTVQPRVFARVPNNPE